MRRNRVCSINRPLKICAKRVMLSNQFDIFALVNSYLKEFKLLWACVATDTPVVGSSYLYFTYIIVFLILNTLKGKIVFLPHYIYYSCTFKI